MNIRKFAFGTLILILIGAVSYFSMVFLISLKKKPNMPRVQKVTPLVGIQKITYSTIPVNLVKQGRLSCNHKVDISSEVQGKILKGDVPLKTGQAFKKGELLFRVYDEEAKLALRATKSRFLTSVANILPDIKYDFESDYQAWTDFFDAIDLEKVLPEIPKSHSAQEKIYLASKNIFNDYYTIQSSEIKLGKHQFFAPFDGSYAQVYLQEGSIANMGTRVASAIRTDILELEVPVEVNQVSFLKTGQPVDLLQGGQVIAKGSVNRISDFVDSKSQSVLVYVSVPNQGKQKLYEGMYLDARFHGFSLENVMKIPRSAVFNFDEVYLVNSNKLQKARVNVVKVEQDVLYFNGPKEGSSIAVELPLNAADQLHVKTQSINQ